MKTYDARVKLTNRTITVRIEANDLADAKTKLAALYGIENIESAARTEHQHADQTISTRTVILKNLA